MTAWAPALADRRTHRPDRRRVGRHYALWLSVATVLSVSCARLN